ncbi:MAG: hypothetical protein ACRD1G_19890 [Acidimicrobiales bacterium]
MAFDDHQLSWLLYVTRPAWSYRLNADFEDHTEHEYALLVEEHPEWENEPFESAFVAVYGPVASVANLSRQISHDERVHKDRSLAHLTQARLFRSRHHDWAAATTWWIARLGRGAP